MPLGGRKSHRRHRHRGHKHRKRDRERDSGLEDGRESPSFGKHHSLCFNKLFPPVHKALAFYAIYFLPSKLFECLY